MRVSSYLNNDAQGRGKKEEEEIAGRESTDCSVYLVVVKMSGLACLNAGKKHNRYLSHGFQCVTILKQ